MNTRREFIRNCAALGVGLSIPSTATFGQDMKVLSGKRIGMIGLDTSHSTAFTKAFNEENPDPRLRGYRVVAAYPYGSRTIESSASRIPGYIDEVKKYGVEIVDSIAALLEKVDVVLLETNDGRPHLEQALPVLESGKRMFIDKPIAASIEDAKAIFDAAEKYQIPTFSTSSLRYVDNMAGLQSGELIGKITGADTFSPATLEPNHPDLFWYGIHGVEMLYALLGTGCQEVRRVYTPGTDLVVGVWEDGRVGTFRGIRSGRAGYGGHAYGENASAPIGTYTGYASLLHKIVEFFETGIAPVQPEETMELLAFMVAADESKRLGGKAVAIKDFLL